MSQKPAPISGLALASSAGVQLLLDAWVRAHAHRVDVWEFAVELYVLQSIGVMTNELRSLLIEGFLVHGDEITRSRNSTRQFRRVKSLGFGETTCFVLTEKGLRFASGDLNSTAIRKEPRSREPRTTRVEPTQRPLWDKKRRELRFGDVVIRRFTHSAPAQELILAAFQEEKWPPVIDDPLPVKRSADPKQRLKNTVKNLNRAQRPKSIRFSTNIGGEAVGWELVQRESRGKLHQIYTRSTPPRR